MLNGSDVIAPNIRGTGDSTGSPNEDGTYLDYEGIYQFVSKKLVYLDKNITGHGYCLSSGPMTNIASQHPINLDIDRGFNKMGDVFGDTALEMALCVAENHEWISKVLKATVPPIISSITDKLIISYDNGSKFPAVKGSVFLLDASKDDVIPKQSTNALRVHLDKANLISSKITFNGKHVQPWDGKTSSKYQEFLAQRGTLRNFGNTPTDTLKERMAKMSNLHKIEYVSTLASKYNAKTSEASSYLSA
ncbi:MAG: hypothetical protein H0U49_10505 [Parachlamydiaceae bacterium]|nr:hypothetical protein [Parachlamydiaceae bacterium]